MERRELNDLESFRCSPTRRSSENRTPIKRQGSRLEVLPPEDEVWRGVDGHRNDTDVYCKYDILDSVKNSSVQKTLQYSREGQSADSDGCGSRNQTVSPLLDRSSSDSQLGSSLDVRDSSPNFSRKQVVLPTIKRDFERHGTPKNMKPWLHCQGDAKTDELNSLTHTMQQADEDPIDDVELDQLLEVVSLKEGEEILPSEEEKVITKEKASNSYYISHTPALSSSETGGPKPPSENGPIENGHISAEPSNVDEEGIIEGAGEDGDEDGEDSSSEESDNDEEDEEELKAPFELMGEFLQAVMDEDYEVAEKLCTMIQLYEPNNPECLQFKPLIEEMLRREREEQLWGSGSEDSSSEEETSSDDDDDDDSDDGEGSDESSSEEDEDEDDQNSDEQKKDSLSS